MVIAKVAILVALLLPALKRSKARRRAIGCGSNLRHFSAVVHVYANHHDGIIVPMSLVSHYWDDDRTNGTKRTNVLGHAAHMALEFDREHLGDGSCKSNAAFFDGHVDDLPHSHFVSDACRAPFNRHKCDPERPEPWLCGEP